MRHAGQQSLDELEPLLIRLRSLAGLTEKKRGVFYLRGKAFLHFHEDPAGLFADLRAADGRDFDRIAVTSEAGRLQLLDLAARRLTAGPTTARADR